MIINIPRIGIVLVHLNTHRDTMLCLRSLETMTYSNVEIIVVDNASTDGSGAKLKEEFPGATHIRSETNEGFTGGNNIGIDYAMSHGCDHVLLLNNDTIITPSFLEPLVERLLRDDMIAAVSGKIYYLPEALGGKENIIWYAGVYQKWHTGYQHYGVLKEDVGKFDVAKPTHYASGCLMLMRGELIKKIGGLWKDYFIYWEESDWCLQAKALGYSCWYEPRSVIYHNFTNASLGNETPFYMYMQMRNSFIFASRNFHGWMKIKHNLLYPIYIMYYFFWLISSKNYPAAKAIFKGIIDYFKGYRGKEHLKERGFIII